MPRLACSVMCWSECERPSRWPRRGPEGSSIRPHGAPCHAGRPTPETATMHSRGRGSSITRMNCPSSPSQARRARIHAMRCCPRLSGECGGYDSHHFTSSCIDPLFPPLDDVWAVIVTSPGRFPVTTPLADTVAVLVLELDQKKVWCGTAFPLASIAVAVSCIVAPGFTFLDGAVTLTVATAAGLTLTGSTVSGLTVMIAMPDFPSELAATCDVPTANAVTTPASEMLTILESCTVQVTAASVTIAPDPS